MVTVTFNDGMIRFWVVERHEWRIDNFQQAKMGHAGSHGGHRVNGIQWDLLGIYMGSMGFNDLMEYSKVNIQKEVKNP